MSTYDFNLDDYDDEDYEEHPTVQLGRQLADRDREIAALRSSLVGRAEEVGRLVKVIDRYSADRIRLERTVVDLKRALADRDRLLEEARRDWIRDTEPLCAGPDDYREIPAGSAIRAFGARIDAVLRSKAP